MNVTETGTQGRAPKGFFAVSLEHWRTVSQCGIDAQVSYLCLARYSSRDNRATSASVNAIETHTGLSRGMARKAINRLMERRCIVRQKGGAHPRYDLRPSRQIKLSRKQAEILALIQGGERHFLGQGRRSALILVEKGLVFEDSLEFCPVQDELIWLPNTLMDGAAFESPPVQKAWETRDPDIMRLLVELYNEQNLAEHGGVDPFLFRHTFERHKVGQQGEYVVWGFRSDQQIAWNREPFAQFIDKSTGKLDSKIWETIGLLKDIGAFEMVPMFCLDSGYSEDRGETGFVPVHPCVQHERPGDEDIEAKIGAAAHAAGCAMLSEGHLKRVEAEELILVPALRHQVNVSMVGVLRARYRPHTARTAAWREKLQTDGVLHIKKYIELLDRAERKILIA